MLQCKDAVDFRGCAEVDALRGMTRWISQASKLGPAAASYTLPATSRPDSYQSFLDPALQKNYIFNYDSDDYNDHVDGIECNDMLNDVQSAIHHVQSVLTSLRDAVKRKIFEETRVFVCTIDATARMVVELAELQVRCRCAAGAGSFVVSPVLARLPGLLVAAKQPPLTGWRLAAAGGAVC